MGSTKLFFSVLYEGLSQFLAPERNVSVKLSGLPRSRVFFSFQTIPDVFGPEMNLLDKIGPVKRSFSFVKKNAERLRGE